MIKSPCHNNYIYIYIYHESNYQHDNRYNHDIILANSNSITSTEIVNIEQKKFLNNLGVKQYYHNYYH